MRDAVVSGALPRVHLVTPAIVDKTMARYGVLGRRGVLTDAEYAVLESLPAERRRADWFAGRVAAKRAVRAALREHGDRVLAYRAIEIWNDADGAPRFTIAGQPELGGDLNISISHDAGAAAAAVANTSASGTIGVDIETTKPLSLALVDRVLRPNERARLQAGGANPTPIVLWAAKEAALKAAHPFCSALRDVELTWNEAGRLRARVTGAGVPAHAIVISHRSAGAYTIAVAFCR